MYSKLISLLLITLFHWSYSFSQCPTSTIRLNTQAEVDAFPMNYPNCDSLIGDLRIGNTDGNSVTDITNLDSLIYLRHIEFAFISDNLFTDLTGLDSLKTGGYVIIARNPNLVDFTGLSNVEYIDRLQIGYNDVLSSFAGLDKLEGIGYFSCAGIPQIVNFQGMESVKINSFNIQSNHSLLNLNGLEGIDSLVHFDLRNNSQLNDISALINLPKIGENVFIQNNLSLSNCSIEAICDAIVNEQGIISIQNNGTGCASATEIYSACQGATDFWLKTQAEVDAFVANSGCTNTVGKLTIGYPFESNITSDITSISTLSCIEIIQEKLIIENNDNLLDLGGLDNLISIGSSFRFRKNKRIKDFMPFTQLQSIGSFINVETNDSLTTTIGLEELHTCYDIHIENNPELLNLDGFTNITMVENDFNIKNCNKLDMATGCESLGTVGGMLYIEDCTGLSSLASLSKLNYVQGTLGLEVLNISNLMGLNNLDSIGGTLYIEEIDPLVNLEGLNSLQKIGGLLEIYYCYYNLVSLDGLERLEYIGSDVYIYENYGMSDISALENLQVIDGDYLSIYYAEALSYCGIKAVCDFLNDPNKSHEIESNLTGCNSAAEVLTDCQSCPNCYITTTNTWLLTATDSDWHNASNWSLGTIPNECNEVIIPAGSTVEVGMIPASCYTLTVEEGAILDVPANTFSVRCPDQ